MQNKENPMQEKWEDEFDKKFPKWGGGKEVEAENRLVDSIKSFLSEQIQKAYKKAYVDGALKLGETARKNYQKGCAERDSYWRKRIEEVNEVEMNRKLQATMMWIADYAYRKANPNGKMDTPSIVYEQVAKDFGKFWDSLTPEKKDY